MSNYLKHIIGGYAMSLFALLFGAFTGFLICVFMVVCYEVMQWFYYWKHNRTWAKALDSLFDIACGLIGFAHGLAMLKMIGWV